MIERTILNFLQHLSSISSETKKYTLKLKKSKTKLLDTRKTTCGLRYLEKYATKMGGAINHRFGLFDDILIKDNNINKLKELIENKSINLSLGKNKRLLMMAVRMNKPEVVDLLLSHGANADVSNRRGKTPLMIAEKRGHKVIKALLKRSLFKEDTPYSSSTPSKDSGPIAKL